MHLLSSAPPPTPQKKKKIIKSSRKARKRSREEAGPPERKESSSMAGQSQVKPVHRPQRKQQEEQREKHQRAASSRARELQQRMPPEREEDQEGRGGKNPRCFSFFGDLTFSEGLQTQPERTGASSGTVNKALGFCGTGSTRSPRDTAAPWQSLAVQRGLRTPEILMLPKNRAWDMCARKQNKTLPRQPSLFGAREGWKQSGGTAGACAHRRCSHPGVPSWESWGLPHWPWDAPHLRRCSPSPRGRGKEAAPRSPT